MGSVLVTGATGYLERETLKQLLKRSAARPPRG